MRRSAGERNSARRLASDERKAGGGGGAAVPLGGIKSCSMPSAVSHWLSLGDRGNSQRARWGSGLGDSDTANGTAHTHSSCRSRDLGGALFL